MNISGIGKLTEFSKNDRFLQKQGKKNTKNNGFDEVLREEQKRVEKELENCSHNNRVTSISICDLWTTGKSRNQRHLDTAKPS